MLVTSLPASCQSVSGGPRSDINMIAAPEPVSPAQPVLGEPQPDTNVTGAPEPVSTATQSYTPQLTPIEKLHITGVAQDVDISQYRLTISGLVEKPLSLTYQNILEYPSVTEVGIIDCPGFFMDVAEFMGVPLSAILAEAGLTSGASQVTFYAIDGYQQKLSLEDVNEYSVFLAYKVNGQTLPPEHGYPLRVANAGSIGATWVKWLESIKVE